MNDIDVNTYTELCPDPVIAVDQKGLIIVFNPAAEALLNYRADDVLNTMKISEIYGGWSQAKSIKGIIDSSEYGGIGRIEGLETEVISKQGRSIPIRLSASLMDLASGQGSIGFFHDLTSRKKLEAKLKELSVTDELTGLYNQRHFYATLEAELERCRRYSHQLSLVCIDLDKFKQVNDRLGHLEGDRLLRFVGQVVKRDLRFADCAFRYGGDEFMVLLPETGLSFAVEIAERLRLSFARYEPYKDCQDKPVKVSLSLGVATTGGFESIESLINRADNAMYEAKSLGGDRFKAASDSLENFDSCECS